MPPLEAFCEPYSTHHVGRNLPWKRQKKTLQFVCSKASLTDGNFSIYLAIRHFTIFQKAALLVKIFLYYGPFFHRLAKISLRMISAALIVLFPFFFLLIMNRIIAILREWDASLSGNHRGKIKARHSQSPSLLISGSGSWLALSFAFAAENIKNLPPALRASEKIWPRLVGKSR